MQQPTDGFADKVRSAWGNPEQVARVGINETFNHDDVFGLDHDDQVDNATRIGVIAGQTADKNPDAFVEAFITLLNDE